MNTEKERKKEYEKRFKESIDFIWMHLRLETLEAEMNKRYENAELPTRVRITYVNN